MQLKSNMSLRRAGLVPCLLLLLTAFCAPAAEAQTRLIVRDSLGLPGINLTCLLTGCQVVTGLGDPNGQLFLVTFPAFLNPVTALLQLNLQLGILECRNRSSREYACPRMPAADPSYLTDETPTSLLRRNGLARLRGATRAINWFAPLNPVDI